MSEVLNMVNIGKRIFKDGDFINGKLIVIDIEKVSKMPEVSENFRVENCIFVTNAQLVFKYKWTNPIIFFKMVVLRKPFVVIG